MFDGDSAVCAVWDAAESVPRQDCRANAGSGDVFGDGGGGVPAGSGIVLLPEAEGAAAVAPPELRGVPSSGECHTALRSASMDA